MALLLGSAFSFLAQDERFSPGLRFCAKPLLRSAVALLGLQIILEQVRSLGVEGAAFIVLAVLGTITFGVVVSRFIRQSRAFGVLSGGAVAICRCLGRGGARRCNAGESSTRSGLAADGGCGDQPQHPRDGLLSGLVRLA